MKSSEADNTHPINDHEFWLRASESSLDSIWDNSEDDVYAALLDP